MKIEIFIWYHEPEYSLSMWRSASRRHIEDQETNYIIFNHRLKKYRKNFKCTNSQIAAIIERAKTMASGFHYITV